MSRWAPRAVVVGLCTAMAWGGCKGPRVDYEKALWASTEHLHVTWRMGTALDLRATYLSSGFRARMLDEQKRLLGPVGDHEAAATRSAQDDAAYHEIVFSAASGLYDDRLAFGDEDGWQIGLVDDQGVAQPLVTVFRLKKASALDRELFAHDTVWSELWVARFAKKTAVPEELVFHVGSGYGHGSARFGGEQLR